jgi:hypothetical protein
MTLLFGENVNRCTTRFNALGAAAIAGGLRVKGVLVLAGRSKFNCSVRRSILNPSFPAPFASISLTGFESTLQARCRPP